VWVNSCSCSGQPFGVSAAELQTSLVNVNDAVQVLLVAGAITSWTGCQECRLAFASLLMAANSVVDALQEKAVKTWTELD